MVTRDSVCICVWSLACFCSRSRELVFPDLGVAGAAASCSSAVHANGMNHFPSFQSSEIKAYGGRKRRGACFIWIFTMVPLSYVTEPSVEEKEKILCVCACLWDAFREGVEGSENPALTVEFTALDCFSCLGSSWSVSVVILSMCMEAHSPERNREGPHMESEAPGSIRPVRSALPGPKPPRSTACHWISDLLIKFAPSPLLKWWNVSPYPAHLGLGEEVQ